MTLRKLAERLDEIVRAKPVFADTFEVWPGETGFIMPRILRLCGDDGKVVDTIKLYELK